MVRLVHRSSVSTYSLVNSMNVPVLVIPDAHVYICVGVSVKLLINYSKVVYFESKCVYPSRVSTGDESSGFMKKINSRYMCAKDIEARFFLTHLKTEILRMKSKLSITLE